MKLQKIASLILALIMVLSLGITAFAADETKPGSVTINGVNADAVYKIYRLLDLESYSVADHAYAYKVNNDWKAFFKTSEVSALFAEDKDGYVTWKGSETISTSDPVIVQFAKNALEYAIRNNIAPVKVYKNGTTDTDITITESIIRFSNLDLGYYLIDTNVGALCGLTTTNPAASINAKNGKPTIDTQVQEDLSLQWGKVNSADIGQHVEFRTTIHVQAGAQNYKLNISLGDGFNATVNDLVTSIVYTYTDDTNNVNRYTLTDANFNVEAGTDGVDFVVVFDEDFCKNLKANGRLVVTYDAMLNRNAVIAGEGNKNTTVLNFGETFETAPSETITYTYGVDIIKTDEQNTLIRGAEFKIYDALTDGTEIKVVPMEQTATNTEQAQYRRARADENGETIVVGDKGVRLVGFDNGTYYLEETKAPEGYNKLTTRQDFTVSDKNVYAIFNSDIYSTGSGVQVINKKGAMLPETGGIGTTIFYVAGGLLVGGAVVALVSKKRMSSK